MCMCCTRTNNQCVIMLLAAEWVSAAAVCGFFYTASAVLVRGMQVRVSATASGMSSCSSCQLLNQQNLQCRLCINTLEQSSGWDVGPDLLLALSVDLHGLHLGACLRTAVSLALCPPRSLRGKVSHVVSNRDVVYTHRHSPSDRSR